MLLKSTLNGKGVMPPKAGRPDLIDEQATLAIEYMIQKAQ